VHNHEFIQKFTEALSDDLNTARALSYIFEYVSAEIVGKTALAQVNDTLGLKLLETLGEDKIPEDITSLAKERAEAKKRRDFALADKLRSQIESEGYVVLDDKNGSYQIKRA
jgi:cysteinyl-tRNA synthetase